MCHTLFGSRISLSKKDTRSSKSFYIKITKVPSICIKTVIIHEPKTQDMYIIDMFLKYLVDKLAGNVPDISPKCCEEMSISSIFT